MSDYKISARIDLDQVQKDLDSLVKMGDIAAKKMAATAKLAGDISKQSAANDKVTKSTEKSTKANKDNAQVVKDLAAQSDKLVERLDRLTKARKLDDVQIARAQRESKELAAAMKKTGSEFLRSQGYVDKLTASTKKFNRVANDAQEATASWWSRFGAVAIGFGVAYRAINVLENGIASYVEILKEGLTAQDEFIELQGKLAIYSQLYASNAESFADGFRMAAVNVAAFRKELPMAISDLGDLTQGVDEFVQHGLAIGPMTAHGMVNFLDFTSMVATTVGASSKQIRQEIQSLFEGVEKPGNTMLRLLKSLIPEFDKVLERLRGIDSEVAWVELFEKIAGPMDEYKKAMLVMSATKAHTVWRKQLVLDIEAAGKLAASMKGLTAGSNLFAVVFAKHAKGLTETMKHDLAESFVSLADAFDKLLSASPKIISGLVALTKALADLARITANYSNLMLYSAALIGLARALKALGAAMTATTMARISKFLVTLGAMPAWLISGIAIATYGINEMFSALSLAETETVKFDDALVFLGKHMDKLSPRVYEEISEGLFSMTERGYSAEQILKVFALTLNKGSKAGKEFREVMEASGLIVKDVTAAGSAWNKAFGDDKDKKVGITKAINAELEEALKIYKKIAEASEDAEKVTINLYEQMQKAAKAGDLATVMDLQASAAVQLDSEIAVLTERIDKFQEALNLTDAGSADELKLALVVKQLSLELKNLQSQLNSTIAEVPTIVAGINALGDEFKSSLTDLKTAAITNGTELAAELDELCVTTYEKLDEILEAALDNIKDPAVIEAVQAIRKSISKVIKGLNDDLTSGIKGLAFKPSNFGDSLADGIDEAIGAMHALNELTAKHIKLQEEINSITDEGRKKQKQDELDAMQGDYILGQLDSYRQLFGGISQLFKENSKEREIMHKAEMAFAAIELAIQAKKMVMDSMTTATMLVNSATRKAAWAAEAIVAAVTGVATQASGGPYVGFALMAAMAAAMTALLAKAGIGFGGSGGGYSGGAEAATTGTVLGDSSKSSESFSNSLDMMEDWHADEYNELQKIYGELVDLNKNITGLVANIVRNFGDFGGDTFGLETSGFFSDLSDSAIKSYKKFIDMVTLPLDFGGQFLNNLTMWVTDLAGDIGDLVFGGEVKIKGSGIALGNEFIASVEDVLAGVFPSVQEYADWKKKGGWLTSTERGTEFGPVDEEVSRLFDSVYSNISNILVYLAEEFEYTAEGMAEVLNYQFANVKLELKGLTGEEITEKISAWISTMGDTAVEELFSEVVGKYQELDEGMLETAMRLITQREILYSILELTNMELGNISISAIDFSQALIAVASDFESLIESIGNYYDKFFTEAEKQEDLSDKLIGTFADLSKEYELLNFTLPTTRDGFRALIESLDLTTEAGKEVYVSLMNNVDAADAYYEYLEDAAEKLQEFNDTLDSVFEDIAMEGMNEYEQSLYEINQKYSELADQLAEENLLYDEQGQLTDIATKAIAAYNAEIQHLASVIINTINETKKQISTLGMDSSQASALAMAARYGVAPSAFQGQSGQALLNSYMSMSSAEIAETLARYGISIDQFNADMMTLGNSWMDQSSTQHSEAQSSRNEMISSLSNAIDDIDAMLADLSPTGQYAPSQSREAFQNKYNELLEQIRTSSDPGKYTSELSSFLPDYLEFMGAFGVDYATLVSSIQDDLEGLNIEFKTERDYLSEIASSSGSTAASMSQLLDLGIPITFNTLGLDADAVAFLQGLQEIVGLVGWDSPFTVDFVSNFAGFAVMPFYDFCNVLSQVANKIPGGWYAQITMDMLMAFENWDDATLQEKFESWGLILDAYGWHSPVVFEFMADMVDSGDISWAYINSILPDEEIRKELIVFLNNSTGLTPTDLAAIFGQDTVASMHIGADLIWGDSGFIDVVVGNAVTIAKFGNVDADTWTSHIYHVTMDMLAELKSIEDNTADLNKALDIEGYASGGLATSPSFAGEIGAEWVVPTYEPQRSSFLEDVGASPEAIGKSVAKYISAIGGDQKEIHVHLEIDGQEIRNPIIVGLKGRDSDLIEAVRRAA